MVPVGLVDFGLPKDCSHEYWDVEKNWNEFRNGLLKHLQKEPLKTKIMSAYQQDRVSKVGTKPASKKGVQLKMRASSVGEMDVPIKTTNHNPTLSQKNNYKDHSQLNFDSISSTTRAFKDFRHGLDHPDETFPVLSVACPERKVICYFLHIAAAGLLTNGRAYLGEQQVSHKRLTQVLDRTSSLCVCACLQMRRRRLSTS